jgi:spermidine synthase
MPRPFATLSTVATPEGPLELRQRGDADFLITIGGRVLMTSVARRSEEALATLACGTLGANAAPRVLIGGLGMGYTLRAALDVLPAGARVVVAELNAAVESWCRGPLAALTGGAILDPRVSIEIADVAAVIAAAPPGGLDAILLDLYEGPQEVARRAGGPFYGEAALRRAHAALSPAGVLAIWSEAPAAAFARRLAGAGFEVEAHRAGRGGRSHVIYLGRRQAGLSRTPGPRSAAPSRRGRRRARSRRGARST